MLKPPALRLEDPDMAKDPKKTQQDPEEEPSAKDQLASALDAARITLASHPRAHQDIIRARGVAALTAFAFVALLSLEAGAGAFDSVLRGLGCGLGAYLIVWGAAQSFWTAALRLYHEGPSDSERRQLEENGWNIGGGDA